MEALSNRDFRGRKGRARVGDYMDIGEGTGWHNNLQTVGVLKTGLYGEGHKGEADCELAPGPCLRI